MELSEGRYFSVNSDCTLHIRYNFYGVQLHHCHHNPSSVCTDHSKPNFYYPPSTVWMFCAQGYDRALVINTRLNSGRSWMSWRLLLFL